MSLELLTLDQALDDVETRFLYNLPSSELNQSERLFFQIEQAYWYYEDFIADKHIHLPHFNNLKSFAKKIFEHCSLLTNNNNNNLQKTFQELFYHYASYKSSIPVYGAIMLNSSMKKMLLVSDYHTKAWMLPRGKINENENEINCAIREVFEETNFDITPYITEDDNLLVFDDQRKIKLYIAMNVPENFPFECKSRKEIADIQFFHIDKLPESTFQVLQFVPKLKRWINQRQKYINNLFKSPKNNNSNSKVDNLKSPIITGLSSNQQIVPNSKKKTANNNTNNSNTNNGGTNLSNILSSPSTSKRLKNLFDHRNPETFDSESAKALKEGWKVEDMFLMNAKLTGRDYNYNGNPHEFGSSHPKYVNYNNNYNTIPANNNNNNNNNGKSASKDSGIAMSEGSLFFDNNDRRDSDASNESIPEYYLPQQFSFQNYDNNNDKIEEMLSNNSNYEWTSSKFKPFIVQKGDILSLMDKVLYATQKFV
eukprot:gene4117-5868_t